MGNGIGIETGLLTLTRERSPSPAATHIFLSTNVGTGILREESTRSSTGRLGYLALFMKFGRNDGDGRLGSSLSDVKMKERARTDSNHHRAS